MFIVFRSHILALRLTIDVIVTYKKLPVFLLIVISGFL